MQSFPRYGIYQATALLGRGGMGSVYLAERADGAYTQQVAIKVLAQHLGGEDFEARFRVERQLLAQMNHPNIVRLLDGGIADSGEAFLVTEYVDGVAMDQYCDGKKLKLPKRIRLFLQVCAAVEHAHQNLIVHRDFKPSNILVTREEGQVKLLDFGTAKLLKGPEEQAVTEVMLLTPRYASPEQLRKDPITTRSDVYSLGMVLYELLSGHRAFGDTAEVVQELARAYQYSEAVPLGDAITAEDAIQRGTNLRELERALGGDLRAICAKALEHDPALRYATARELSEDLEAYLSSRPVKARPANFWYRTRKFVYRQRVAVIAASLLAVATGSGIYTTLHEKRLAERRFGDVRRLAHYQIFELYDQMLEVDGTTRLRAGMLEEGLRYLNVLAREASGDEALAVELALGYLRVGDVTGNYAVQSLGRWKDALTTYQKGLDVLARYSSFDARRARVLLEYSYRIAQFAVEPKTESAALIEASLPMFAALVREEPRNLENHLRLGKAYQAVGRSLQVQRGMGGFADVSEEWVRKAKVSFETGLELDAESKPLLLALHQLAGERAIWIAQAKPQEALRWCSEAQMWRMRLPASLREAPLVKRDFAATLSSRAAAMGSLGQNEDALVEMNLAVEIFEALSRDPDNLAAQMDLLSALNNRGLLQYDLGLKQDYMHTAERSLAVATRLYAASQTPRADDFRLKALYNLSYARSELKDTLANDTLAQTFRALEQRAAADSKDILSRGYLADLLLNLQHPGYDQSDRALPIAQAITSIAPGQLNGWELVAEANLQLKNYAGAVEALEKGLATMPAPKNGAQASAIYLRISQRIESYREKLATAARQ